MKKNIETIIIIGTLLFFLVTILAFPKEVMESVSFSISIWKDNLFPSLFPFLILNYLLTNYGVSLLLGECTKPLITNIFHLPASCGFTLIASMFSGFPSSSKFIKEQLDKKEINLEEANYLLSFCHFSSPLFIIGTIGNALLGSKKLGMFILLAHYLGNFIIAYIFRPKGKKTKEKKELKKVLGTVKRKITNADSFANTLKNAITNALEILFLLLGIVSIFLIITNLVTILIPVSNNIKTILSSILEMTQGVKNISLLNTSIFNKAIFMLSVISFGGLSVHTQIFSIMANYKVSYPKFLKARILHVLFSTISFFILEMFFNFIERKIF